MEFETNVHVFEPDRSCQSYEIGKATYSKLDMKL